jgi:hypothetical protein
MGVELVGDPLKGRYVPGDDVYIQCYELGKKVAGRLNEKFGG